MKLVIDISEDDYRKAKDGRASVSMMLKAIRNGTPLDKIRAEIEKKHTRAKQINSVLQMNAYIDCLQIIDKHKAETEQVGNSDRFEKGEI